MLRFMSHKSISSLRKTVPRRQGTVDVQSSEADDSAGCGDRESRHHIDDETPLFVLECAQEADVDEAREQEASRATVEEKREGGGDE